MGDSDAALTNIIERLRALEVEERHISQERQNLIDQLAQFETQASHPQGTNGGRVSPDRQDDDFVQVAQDTPPGPYANKGNPYEVGQAVHIENQVRHVPGRRPPTIRDRAAIVTRLTTDRVYLTTFNGHHTWRRPRNLRYLTSQEKTVANR